jgi:hypothetical protein
MISPLLEGCAQAILVENCFSNFVNIGSFQRVYFRKFWSSVKFIWPMLCPLKNQILVRGSLMDQMISVH